MKKITLFLAMAVAVIACQKEAPVTPEVKVTSDEAALVIAQDGFEPIYIDFESNVAWTAAFKDAAVADWCAIAPTSGEAGKTKIRVTASENPDNADRTATIVITAQSAVKEVVVTQLQKNALVAGATSFDVPSEGGKVKVKISHNVQFTVTPGETWITQVQTKALSETELEFDVAANPSLEARTGKITVTAGDLKQEITVNQAEFVPTFEFSNNEIWFSYEGGTAELEVTTDYPEYELSIQEGCDWLTVVRNGDKYTFTAEPSAEYNYRYAELNITGYYGATYYVFQNGCSSVKWQKSLTSDYGMTLAAGSVRIAMSGDMIFVANNGKLQAISKADGSAVQTIDLPAGIVSVTNDDAGHLVFATDMVYNPIQAENEDGTPMTDGEGNPIYKHYNDAAQVYYIASLQDQTPILIGEVSNDDIWTNGSATNLRVSGDVTKDAVITWTLPGINYWVGLEVKNGAAGDRVFGGLAGVNGYGYGHGVFAPLGATLADGIAATGYATPYNLYVSNDAQAKNFVTVLNQNELINPDATHWNGNDDPNSIYGFTAGDKNYIAVGIGTHFSYTQARVNMYDVTDRSAVKLVGKLTLPDSSASFAGATGAWSDVVAEYVNGKTLVYYVSGNNAMVMCFEIN